jgi:hypothetical protein
MNPHYQAVAERAGHRCEYCRAPDINALLALAWSHHP